MTKPFRFGVQCGGSPSAVAWRTLARRAEDLGYATLYVPDHFVETVMAPMVAMACAAEATTTLRVAALVFGNDFKHPAVLAKEMATLDVLSEGRTELGIGAGWLKADYDAIGLPYDRPGARIARLEEALRVIKDAWSPGPRSFGGAHYAITEYDGLPKPLQQPHPPILVGGGGQRILTLAGREADIVGINPNLRRGAISDDAAKTSLASLTDQKIEWVRGGAGERFDSLELQIRYFLAAITDDRDGFAATIAPAVGLTPEDALASSLALVGTVDEVCDQLVERRERWGVSYVVIGDDQLDAFAPVVERLAGT